MILIKNAYVKTMAGSDLENGCVLIGDDGKIAAVGKNLTAPNAEVVDANGRLVTPGFVESHCHTGLRDLNVGDYNEKSDPITPHMRAIDAINPQDEYMSDAVRGGVTTICTGPGSTNVVGGTFAAVKTYGVRVDKMIVKDPVAMKCAFGHNPKNAFGSASKKMPYTRMAVAMMLRDLLTKAEAYRDEKDNGKNPKYDAKLEAMLPVMRKEIPLKCHAHRADDILTAVRIAKEFGVKMTLDHCTEGHLIAEELAEEGYPALVGPSLGGKSKMELFNKTFDTAGILHKAGLKVCVITDAGVIPIQFLGMCAGLAASRGLSMEEAWKAITINPAEVMGIADRVGSLEPGKDADVVIWTADPLTTVGAEAYMTFVDGKLAWKNT